jgi:hypothetical protein
MRSGMASPAPVLGIVWPSTLELPVGTGAVDPDADGEDDADGDADSDGIPTPGDADPDAEGDGDIDADGDELGVCAEADGASSIKEPIAKQTDASAASARERASFLIGTSFQVSLSTCPPCCLLCVDSAGFSFH